MLYPKGVGVWWFVCDWPMGRKGPNAVPNCTSVIVAFFWVVAEHFIFVVQLSLCRQ